MSFRGFYGIADSQFGDIGVQAELLLQAGACAVQLRCKDWHPSRVEAEAQRLFPQFDQRNVPLIVNDLFLPHCSHGVHLGQEDGPLPRTRCPKGFLIGRSTHSLPQLSQAIAEGADYAGFGPIFGTQTKSNAGPSLGIERLREAVALNLPLVAIGGISLETLPQIQETGTAAWTAISAIWKAPDPRKAIEALSASSD